MRCSLPRLVIVLLVAGVLSAISVESVCTQPKEVAKQPVEPLVEKLEKLTLTLDPGLAEIVLDGQTGILVDPGSKIDLARQTNRLLDDLVLRAALGSAARRRAQESFSPHAFAARWQQACLEAAA